MKTLRPRRKIEHLADQLDFEVLPVGRPTEHVGVFCARELSPKGVDLAAKLLEKVENTFLTVQRLFKRNDLPKVTLILAPLSDTNAGQGGAYHYGCNGTTLYVDADFVNVNAVDRCLSLFVAELAEVGEALLNNGWDCGASNGEALSRVVAEYMFPGALADYACAPAWIQEQAKNWIDSSAPSDGDEVANGCGVLFLWWLVSTGCQLPEIIAAGGSTLADTYETLTGNGTAWSDFTRAVKETWPDPSRFPADSDNAWADAPSPATPPPSVPTTSPTPTASVATLTLSADLVAGSYLLLPAAVADLVKKAGLGAGDVLKLLTLILSAAAGGQMSLAELLNLLAGAASLRPSPVPNGTAAPKRVRKR